MANPQIIVEYIANTAKLSSATGDIDKQGGKVTKTMGGVGAAIGGAFAVAGVVAFGKSAVSAAQESEEATSRLEQVFKSMGDTTGDAAKSAEEYASALSAKTAIEDESIMKGQAILATFGKVSSETARMAGVFDRATAAGADMAAAGFGSIEGNAVQLGKALNDPIKGITALAKSGVTFTEQEKEKIKTLVESGKQLEAQQMILGAIEKQVKGTAEATASESDKMNVAFGETSEALGMVLLPFIEALAPILAKVAGFIAKNSSVIVPLVAGILGAAAAIKVITIAQIAWNIAVSANPIGAIIIAIAALGVAIYLLIKNWDKVKEAMAKAFGVMLDAGKKVFNWLKDNWPLLVAILLGPIGIITLAVVKKWGDIEEAARSMWRVVKEVFGNIAGWIEGQVGRVSRAVERIVSAIKDPINAVLRAWNAIGFTVPKVSIPAVKVAGKEIFGGADFGGQTFSTPDVPLLARGGVVSSPTLAMIGEGRGREIVAPEALLRSIIADRPLEVRVFIGDQELRGLVKTEIVKDNTGLARTLLAGAR